VINSPNTRLATTYQGLPARHDFSDKFGIFLYMNLYLYVRVKMAVNISALSGPQCTEERFVTQNSQYLTKKILTSVDNNQRTDYSFTCHKKVN
jgi:hypothetical protein